MAFWKRYLKDDHKSICPPNGVRVLYQNDIQNVADESKKKHFLKRKRLGLTWTRTDTALRYHTIDIWYQFDILQSMNSTMNESMRSIGDISFQNSSER